MSVKASMAGLFLLSAAAVSAGEEAPVYEPSLWNTGDVQAIETFRQQQKHVLEQIRVWHYGSGSVAGIGKTLEDNSDAQIAKALRLEQGEISVFRNAFKTLAGNTQLSGNCYTYLLDDRRDHPPGWKAEPGEYGGYDGVTGATYKDAVRNFIGRVTADGLIDAGTNPAPREGYYLGAMYLRLKQGQDGAPNDFHFVRQDRNGGWSHKMGLEPVSNMDFFGNVITDPATANFDAYKFVTYLYVPEGGLRYDSTQNVPKKTDIAANSKGTQEILENDTGEAVPLKQCFDNKGVEVRFQRIAHHYAMDPHFWMALSVYTPMSGPVIKFDKAITSLPAKTIAFAAAHECAHHKLGHPREVFMSYATNGYVAFSAGKNHSYELAADCEAIKDLQEGLGYGEQDIKEIFAPFPANESSQNHPPTSERVKRALGCLKP